MNFCSLRAANELFERQNFKVAFQGLGVQPKGTIDGGHLHWPRVGLQGLHPRSAGSAQALAPTQVCSRGQQVSHPHAGRVQPVQGFLRGGKQGRQNGAGGGRIMGGVAQGEERSWTPVPGCVAPIYANAGGSNLCSQMSSELRRTSSCPQGAAAATYLD